MSKSAENDLSRINLTDDAAAIKNKVGFAWHDREGWIKDFHGCGSVCVAGPALSTLRQPCVTDPPPTESGVWWGR